VLNINFLIIMAPMSQVEYVVAHELCHLRHKDHSAEFWDLLRLLMPDYEIRKERLRKEGWRYVL
jgi:predicted metal-dependent hydrolase